jgi:branched-chain amino acid transport system substrate-binding protein
MSPDDAQAAADAMLVHQLGAADVFVIDDGGYGAAPAHYFKRAAGRLDVRIAGSATWQPQRPRFAEIASRARASGTEAVYLCGLIDSGAGELLAALRHALEPSVDVIGCDGLLPVSLLFEHAGRAARGVYVSLEGVVKERLGSTGRKFLREFGATQPGKDVDIAAIYAAQATEVLVAAIARSDGTRASVSSQLFGARVRNGLIGDFAIDELGDPVPAPVTILRLQHGRGANVVLSYSGAAVDRVITPPARLLAR